MAIDIDFPGAYTAVERHGCPPILLTRHYIGSPRSGHGQAITATASPILGALGEVCVGRHPAGRPGQMWLLLALV